MKRTGEVVLGVIGTILNVLLLVFIAFSMFAMTSVSKEELQDAFNQEVVNDPTLTQDLTQEEIIMINDGFMNGVDIAGVVGWVMIVLLFVSIVFSIIATVLIAKNRAPKASGIFFILAGLLSGVLLLAPILFYIAGIMAFVRKPPMAMEQPVDPFYTSPNQPL